MKEQKNYEHLRYISEEKVTLAFIQNADLLAQKVKMIKIFN